MFKDNVAFVVKVLAIIFILLTIIVLLYCCKKSQRRFFNNSLVQEIEYTDTVSDKTIANSIKKIADNYFINELSYDIEKYGSVTISFAENSQMWIVTYFLGKPEEYYFGGDVNICISEKDKIVMSHWIGE